MKSIKVRIYPNTKQKEYLNKCFGCSRFVYNELLSRTEKEYQDWINNPTQPRPGLSKYTLVDRIVELKSDFPWLDEALSVSLQQSAMDLYGAYQSFFNGRGRPRYKSKHRNNSFRVVGASFRIESSRLWLSKISPQFGLLKTRWDSRGLPKNPKSVTISKTSTGKYYASFRVEDYSTNRCGEGIVGIDLGLTDLAVSSDGTRMTNHRYLTKSLKRLRLLSRRLARRTKGSANRNKARMTVAKQHERVTNRRTDHLHKLSRKLIDENQVIVMETLSVGNMVRNKRLARSINDVSWNTLVQMLRYKAKSAGANILHVGRWYPSTQICSVCDHRLEGESKLTLSVRSWTCPKCDSHHDRDLNAAKNLLKAGVSWMESRDLDPGVTYLIDPVL